MKFRAYGEDAVITNRPLPEIEAEDMLGAVAQVKLLLFSSLPEGRLQMKVEKEWTELQVKGTLFKVRIVPADGLRYPFEYREK
jgi:hypothetical protein